MTSNCYKPLSSNTNEKEMFKMNIIKQAAYLDNLKKIIGEKYDTE